MINSSKGVRRGRNVTKSQILNRSICPSNASTVPCHAKLYSTPNVTRPSISLQEILSLINLHSEVRTPASIWMIKEHKLSVILPYLVLRERPFTAAPISLSPLAHCPPHFLAVTFDKPQL